MQRQARDARGRIVRASDDPSAGRNPLLQELAAQPIGIVKLLPVFRIENRKCSLVFISRREVSGRAQLEQGAFRQVPRKIGHQLFIPKQVMDLDLVIASQGGLRSELVYERRIQIGTLRNRVLDQLIDSRLIFQEQPPVEVLALVEVLELLSGHQRFRESPQVLDDVLACTNGPGGVLGVPEDHQPGFVYQLRGPLVHLRIAFIERGERRVIRFFLQPLPNHVLHLLASHSSVHRQPAGSAEDSRRPCLRSIRGLPFRGLVGGISGDGDGGHAIVEEQLSQPRAVVHVHVDQTGDNELSRGIDDFGICRISRVFASYGLDLLSLDHDHSVRHRRFSRTVDDRRAFQHGDLSRSHHLRPSDLRITRQQSHP